MSETRLLAVSHDRATRSVLGRLCRKRGFHLTTVETLAEFKKQLKQKDIQLVVLDLDNTNCDGVRLLHHLAVSVPDMQVLLTSDCDRRTLDAVHRLGRKRGVSMAEPLVKPLEENRCVRSILDALCIDDPTITSSDIRKAIEKSELKLHYQPLIDLKTGTVRSIEALLRWQHPQYGDLSPELVVTLAETHGLIGQLTQWVTRTALKDLKAWHKQGWRFSVAVNVSAPLLLDPDFADDIVRLAKEVGVAPHHLVLEITESEAITEVVEVLETLTRLRLNGFDLAIDDFGTGYSSLGRLHRMPFTELKIDKSFVMETTDDTRAETVVRAISDLGHNLEMSVVAEGVSSREAWDLVAAVGCDLAQGFFISRPIPADQLTDWLYRWDVPSSVTAALPAAGMPAKTKPAKKSARNPARVRAGKAPVPVRKRD